ncbi:MAG: hypothetical protein DRQ65_09345 [Gammaproteobacteria bacterium]|nr:MAG: hypothetical protein DRQ65_09345 [Gammaproteobacteria bacterium]
MEVSVILLEIALFIVPLVVVLFFLLLFFGGERIVYAGLLRLRLRLELLVGFFPVVIAPRLIPLYVLLGSEVIRIPQQLVEFFIFRVLLMVARGAIRIPVRFFVIVLLIEAGKNRLAALFLRGSIAGAVRVKSREVLPIGFASGILMIAIVIMHGSTVPAQCKNQPE